MEEKKENRGGKREGSGRKERIESKQIALFLELDLCDALAKVPNRTFYINAAVRYAIGKGSEFEEYARTLKAKRDEDKDKEKKKSMSNN